MLETLNDFFSPTNTYQPAMARLQDFVEMKNIIRFGDRLITENFQFKNHTKQLMTL